jgi:hypothetical protein
MKKSLIVMTIALMLMACVHAESSTVKINGTDFEIPDKYQGGELKANSYKLDNIFSIRCIDDDVIGAIGLWAAEKDFSEDANIAGHPVRHYCQYNRYVGGNHSHAYFASGNSIYEIAWTGKEINLDIKKLIENAPKSEMDEDAFYNMLDKSADIYKELEKDRLNSDGEYNYLEAKYSSQSNQPHTDNTRIKEILLAYYYR